MNAIELKKQFNLLYNNINNNAAPGLSDSEIEMFLNKAQDEIVKQHVLGANTNYQLGINQTSKRDVELDTLIKTWKYTKNVDDSNHYYKYGFMFSLETDDDPPQSPNILIILSENIMSRKTQSIEGGGFTETFGDTLDVVELSFAQFNRYMSGIYKFPKKNQCWKLRHDSKVEIIFPINQLKDMWEVAEYNDSDPPPAYPISYESIYSMTYVEMPPKIELTYVAPATEAIGCSLPEVLHMEIVQRAVELAKAAYASADVNVQMTMGQRSE